MVFGVVQRGEAVPVGLDLGAFGHVESHRAEDGLDALHGARHRVQSAATALAPGQRDVKRLGLELGIEFGVGERLAAGGERSFDLLLGGIDQRTTRFFLVGWQRCQRLELLGQRARFTEKARLGVFQIGGR